MSGYFYGRNDFRTSRCVGYLLDHSGDEAHEGPQIYNRPFETDISL